MTEDKEDVVEQWLDSCELTLMHDAKLSKSFNSARWKKGLNPDLIFTSASTNTASTLCEYDLRKGDLFRLELCQGVTSVSVECIFYGLIRYS